jgi:hypothetical protein
MAKTVVALLDNPDEARKAVDELLQSGFQKKDIGVVANVDVPAEFKAVMKDMDKGAAVGRADRRSSSLPPPQSFPASAAPRRRGSDPILLST